jgi:prepilin-type N-terminal cleavage/methylation domain-containing protein
MKKLKKRAKRGFTLIEILCAVVILLLLSLLMVAGVRVAVKSLNIEMQHSESQILCSSLRTIVNDELRYAGSIDMSGTEIAFFSQNYGEKVTFTTDEEGHVLLGEDKVLSTKSYPYGMRAEVTVSSYDTESRIFDASVKVTNEDGDLLAEATFQVKQLNKPAEVTG